MDLLTPQFKTHCLLSRCGCRRSMCRPRVFAAMSVFARPVFGTHLCPRVFAAMSVFARPVFGTHLRPPTCLRDDAGLRPTCLREVSSPAHVSSRRRVSSPALSSGRVFARPCVFATRGSSPDLSSGRVFARPRVFSTTRAFGRPVLSNRLLARTSLLEGSFNGFESNRVKSFRPI